ncbi:MAG: Transketolase central region [Phycisphaerales bacterium]|nr:Transketolase central region [Phycisphaerales bacterium]MDB5354030.1 Transketolase central region [Phycisphaerales bacterium]
MSFQAAANRKAIDIGKLSVEMTTSAGSGHPSTSLSLAHLITVLLYHQMRWDPKDPWNPYNDRLVLSEGHAVPIIYAAYADIGGVIGKTKADARPMTKADALTLRAIDSPIDGHPHPQLGFHFFDAATGSLGQGLSVAAGLGAAARMDGVDRNIYCIIGDGESREGQIWEAADFIVDHALTNVIPIFNCNDLAQSDYVSPQQSYQGLAEKLKAFGFIVRVIDGHDPAEIKDALDELNVIKNGNRPLGIVARTVKGWGAPDEQGMGKHGTPVKKDKLPTILGELDQTAKDLGVADYKPDSELKIPAPKVPAKPVESKPIKIAPFAEGLAAVGLDKDLAAGKPIAPRKAYGAALVALGGADKRIVGLDADVKNSTHAEWFAKRYPSQYLECKIAEQNMISVGAGLSAAGKIPFCSTFAKFVVRAYDQVEMAIIGGANLKITGTHAGVTLASDGPSQMSLPDVAFFRSFCHTTNFNGRPAVTYFFPADAVSCYKTTELMANLDGTCYQRALRADVKALYKPEETFEVGGYKVLREGKDVVFVSAGYMVHECLKVADELAKNGKKATVIDAYSLPLQTKGILEIAQKNGGTIITAEDNYTGGLDAELATAIAQTGAQIKLKNLYVHQIPKSGREPQDVLDYLGLGAKQILAAV